MFDFLEAYVIQQPLFACHLLASVSAVCHVIMMLVLLDIICRGSSVCRFSSCCSLYTHACICVCQRLHLTIAILCTALKISARGSVVHSSAQQFAACSSHICMSLLCSTRLFLPPPPLSLRLCVYVQLLTTVVLSRSLCAWRILSQNRCLLSMSCGYR